MAGTPGSEEPTIVSWRKPIETRKRQDQPSKELARVHTDFDIPYGFRWPGRALAHMTIDPQCLADFLDRDLGDQPVTAIAACSDFLILNNGMPDDWDFLENYSCFLALFLHRLTDGREKAPAELARICRDLLCLNQEITSERASSVWLA